jgi:hypothetical protein
MSDEDEEKSSILISESPLEKKLKKPNKGGK